jgi:hypothetical protein
MTTTLKATYTAQGFPDTIMTFDLTGLETWYWEYKERIATKEEGTRFKI